MTSLRASTRRAVPAAFLLFAAGLLVVTPAEASRTTTDARPGLSSASSEALLSPLLERPAPGLASPMLEPSGFSLGEDLSVFDTTNAQGSLGLCGLGASRCALTYARNNPLKYVDPDGKENELAWDAMQRDQVREHYGDAAVTRMDQQRAVIGVTALGLLAGGVAAAEWGPAAMALGRELFTRFGDKVDEAVAESRAVTSLARFERGISFEARQVQEKFDQHKSVLGITANWSKAAGAAFEGAIKAHVENANTMVIKGTFHKMGVTHFLDPRTGINVMRDSAGKFLSVFRLNPDQLRNVMERGSL